VRLKLNGTHKLLVYIDDVKLLCDNVDTINRNTETLIDAVLRNRISKFGWEDMYVLSSEQRLHLSVKNQSNRQVEKSEYFKYFYFYFSLHGVLHYPPVLLQPIHGRRTR
jgi:hypothetical protein